MVVTEKALYDPTIANCEEILITPFTHIFISCGFTLFFFVIAPAALAGNGPLASVLTFLTLCWYLLCYIVDIYRDYKFYDKRPNYEQFARCLLNKEYNERLFFKSLVIVILAQRFVACLMRCDVGALGIKIFRIFMKLFYAFIIPALVARGVATLGAGIGMGWPFIYLFIVGTLFSANSAKIQLSPGMLWLSAAELMVTGSDEEQDAARLIMTAAEGALVSLGEEVPSPDDLDDAAPAAIVATKNDPTDENAGEQAPKEAAPAPVASAPKEPAHKHAKLNFFATRADRESILFKFLAVIGAAITAYISVVAWDWSYGQNGINYSSAWTAFNIYRPTAQTLYDNRHSLTAAQAAYVASLFC